MRKLLLLLIVAGLGYWGWRYGRRAITQTADDAALTAQVLADIAKSQPMALLSVKASAKNGTVHLQGHVKTRQDEDKLLETVKDVKGVNRVDNHLTLDDRIRTKEEVQKDLELLAVIKKNLIEEEGLRGMQIHVSVDQGIVTLSGEVPSPEQAHLATEIARSVKGVKSVLNQIRVKGRGGH